jgi:hypothetical protein
MEQDSEKTRQFIHEVVRETLTGLGFTLHPPGEIQSDMVYLRKLRQGSEETTRILRNSTITIVVSSLLYLLWEAIKHRLHF